MHGGDLQPARADGIIREKGQTTAKITEILKQIKAGEEIAVTRRDKPVEKITALNATKETDWPDFHDEAIELKGDYDYVRRQSNCFPGSLAVPHR